MSTPLPRVGAAPGGDAVEAGLLQELAQAFLALENACAFYPESHQGRRAPLERLLGLLRAEARAAGGGSLGFAGESVLWRGGLHEGLPGAVRKFADKLAARGVARVFWTEDLTAEELQRFVEGVARGRSAAEHSSPERSVERYEHLRVEALDYGLLLAESGESGGEQRRREAWKALLLRLLRGPETKPAAEDLALARASLKEPAALASALLEVVAPGALSGYPAAVRSLRRFAALLEQSAGRDQAQDDAAALGAVGGHLPAELRLRLLESAADDPAAGLFSHAFGALAPMDGLALLARTFSMDPTQIERLTRVFQHLVPRSLERMELAPRLREQIRVASDELNPLADNAWQEVEELLTGELVSTEYREQLRRLAAREALRRSGEEALAGLPQLAGDLSSAHAADESRWIQFEQLHLATSAERYRGALEGIVGFCGVALAAGDPGGGLPVLRRLLEIADGTEPLAGPREQIAGQLRSIVTEPMLAALIPVIPGLAPGDHAAVLTLVALAPEAGVPALLDALASEEDAGRRREIAAFVDALGSAAVPGVLRRIATAQAPEAKLLLPFLAETGDPAAVPALLGVLRGDDPKLRRDALRVLARMDAPEVGRALAGLLEDADEEIVQVAATRLGALGSPETVRELLRAFDGGVLVGRRAARLQRAIFVLGRMRAPEAVAPLGELLVSRVWFSRRVRDELTADAAQALGRIGGDAARQALTRAAAGGPESLASVCRRQLARWGARESPE